jgi:hypothetical protein
MHVDGCLDVHALMFWRSESGTHNNTMTAVVVVVVVVVVAAS